MQERLTAAVTEAVAAAEAAADEAQQQICALQEEASGLRATNTALHSALEEVHAAAASYQVSLPGGIALFFLISICPSFVYGCYLCCCTGFVMFKQACM
jgi:hypothetical protein